MSTAKGRFDGPLGLAVLVMAVVVGAALLERFTRPGPGGEFTDPTPMPALLVEGWLNVPGPVDPAVENLRGRWVVIDSWATNCPPCLQSMPKLAAFYDEWAGRGVELIGLTSEPASYLPEIESVLGRFDGIDWPVGYGAGMVNGQLGVTMIPNYTLFDPQGRSVWRGHSIAELEAVLSQRL